MDDDTISIPAAADLLGLTRAGVYWKIANGRLPAETIAGKMRVRFDVIEQLLQEQATPSVVARADEELAEFLDAVFTDKITPA